MIVTRTPFRVTLGGGGTDLPSFYRQHGGFIFGMGIDKYMYIMLNPPIVDNKIRLHYSKSEVVEEVSELKHELAREALRLHGFNQKMEISSMADLPDGTGLGSSGSYLVGLLTALHHYRRDYVSMQLVAEEACYIELDVLGKGIGKQDQYMAAFGGLTVLDISTEGAVCVRPINLPSSSVDEFVVNTHLYYTGYRRSAEDVLRGQNEALSGKGSAAGAQTVSDSLLRIKDLGYRILDAVESQEYDRWGELLHEHWCHKKQLSQRVSLNHIDELYETVRSDYGVLGGKIVGAGGGGFLMLYVPRGHRRLEQFMAAQGMPRLHYKVEHAGSRVVADLGTAQSQGLLPTPMSRP